MKYKVGDKVRIKSIDWYNRYTNGTEVNCKHYPFSCHMKKYCGQIMTISDVIGHSYDMIEDNGRFCWNDEMFDGLVERFECVDKMFDEDDDDSTDTEDVDSQIENDCSIDSVLSANALIDKVANDVKSKIGSGLVGLIFPILSRNRL